ncbi:hypothetical protein EF294_14960 [Gordonia oryzae]|uniref:Uncharacterized protein n=1 Tax=Gordonia oryzae TaxID=2487349 RepID=A0A3N4G8T6_9ACTN|nr:hypothetical protein EF294_14960 [Gordonia oryzae]
MSPAGSSNNSRTLAFYRAAIHIAAPHTAAQRVTVADGHVRFRTRRSRILTGASEALPGHMKRW